MAKIYVLASGEVFDKLKEKKYLLKQSIEKTDTWVIGGPFDECARNYFQESNEWQCFDTVQEAKDASNNL